MLSTFTAVSGFPLNLKIQKMNSPINFLFTTILRQLLQVSVRFSDRLGYESNLLDLFLTFKLLPYTFNSFLGSRIHLLISVLKAYSETVTAAFEEDCNFLAITHSVHSGKEEPISNLVLSFFPLTTEIFEPSNLLE